MAEGTGYGLHVAAILIASGIRVVLRGTWTERPRHLNCWGSYAVEHVSTGTC